MSADWLQRLLANPQVEELYVNGMTTIVLVGEGERVAIGPELSDAEVEAMLERLAARGGHGE